MSVRWLFAFFVVSGACSLVYEVVWLRLAMAAFGVNTPLVSIVLSIFMGGLALGTWLAGRLVARLGRRSPVGALRLYAVAELIVAAGSVTVPLALAWGRASLITWGAGTWGSGAYYAGSGVFVAGSMLPFCVAMGTTFPLAMHAIRRDGAEGERAFSYLYLANVLGATAGTVLSAFVLIELLGFRHTLLITGIFNAGLAATALVLTAVLRQRPPAAETLATPATSALGGSRRALLALFLTGLTSMALEVVWVREFAPYLSTVVYAFALILAVYLIATVIGAQCYRRASRRWALAAAPPAAWSVGWALLGGLALISLLAADARLPLPVGFGIGSARLLVGLAPFCAALGFLTPMLIDRYSGGDPRRAADAYAVNVLGAIIGPLLSGFWLLPRLGERGTLVALAVALAAAGWWAAPGWSVSARRDRRFALAFGASALLGLALLAGTRDFEQRFGRRAVLRDYTASVIATGEGRSKQLIVNGFGVTILTPVTKMMAHLPLALLSRPPERALVICFGMGTTFRSLLSWGIDTTAVELVPSVPALAWYFHADADALLRSPRAHVVIDDGRRFLERTTAVWDVITVDPPPPSDGAGASLLYSREFYDLVKRHLAPDGILQQWLPRGGPYRYPLGGFYSVESHLDGQAAIVRALRESFPHVRAVWGLGRPGVHFLASQRPIPAGTPAALAARLPAAAAADLVEWGPLPTPDRQIAAVWLDEVSLDDIIWAARAGPALDDDRPVNEYFFVRRALRDDYHVYDEDFQDHGRRTRLEAISLDGFTAAAQGLALVPEGAGAAVYRFRSHGVKRARLTLFFHSSPDLATWVETSPDGQHWSVVNHNGYHFGHTLDLTSFVAGRREFFLRFRAARPPGGPRLLLALERFAVEWAD